MTAMRVAVAVCTLVVALLAGAVPAAHAQDVVVDFDDRAAGTNANETYLSDKGFIFGPGVENPEGGEFPTTPSCGLTVSALPGAPSGPNVATLGCGGSAEFPDPPVLYGKVTTTTRTRVSVRVGTAGSSLHVLGSLIIICACRHLPIAVYLCGTRWARPT